MCSSDLIYVGKAVEQTALYKTDDRECGAITLRREPDLLAAKRERFASYAFPSTWIKMRGYDTFQGTPLCGNDPWIGTLEVFFDKDKSLAVGAHRWNPSIMEFAQKADFASLKEMMNKR